MEVWDVVLYDGRDEVLFIRHVLAIVVVAANDDGGGNLRQPLKEVDREVDARRTQNVLVMKDVARDDNDGRIVLDLLERAEQGKEVLERTQILVFTRST